MKRVSNYFSRRPLGMRSVAMAWGTGLAVLLGVVVVSLGVTLHDPLYGEGDVALWHFMTQFFSKNLGFSPLPHLKFMTDEVFYPFGIEYVFQAWCLEREYLVSLFSHVFGQGPWMQGYFLASLVCTATGLWIVLATSLGMRAAAFFSLFATFANSYLLHKFPAHVNMAVAHWTLLSLATDFVLFEKVVRRSPIALSWIAWRFFLGVAVCGLDLGYVAGYGLSSFLVATVCGIGLLVLRRRRGEKILWKGVFSGNGKATAAGFFLAGCTLLFLYLPVLLDIVRTTQKYHFAAQAGYWANPLRLLVPQIPGIDRINAAATLQKIFGDSAEEAWDWTGGLALALLAASGAALLVRARRAAPLGPLFLLFVLCIAYHPQSFPTLRIFPWFAFQRGAGRSTVVLPLVLSLVVALAWKERGALRALLPRRSAWVAPCLALLVALAAVEFATGLVSQRKGDAKLLSVNQKEYFESVRAAPGDALFTFPPCFVGGNGIGEPWCPNYQRLANLHYLGVYSGKKELAHYLGRVHPSQLEPFARVGFRPLLQRVHEGSWTQDCLTPGEWDFLALFVKQHSFAGVQLLPDFLAPQCLPEFVRRFGAVKASANFEGLGDLAFIPLPQISRLEGAGAVLQEPISDVIDFAVRPFSPGFFAKGFRADELDGQGRGARLVQQDECLEADVFPREKIFRTLRLGATSTVDGQTVRVKLNGSEVWLLTGLPHGQKQTVDVPLTLNAGFNRLQVCADRRLSNGALTVWKMMDFSRITSLVTMNDELSRQRAWHRENRGLRLVYEEAKLVRTEREQ